MAYNNSNNDTKNMSAVYVERTNNRGEKSKYFSFTFEHKGEMLTCRVYADSTYTPSSGKHKDKLSCPVRVTKWDKTTRGGNKW